MFLVLLIVYIISAKASSTYDEAIERTLYERRKRTCTNPEEEYLSCGHPCEATCASLDFRFKRDFCNPKNCVAGCFCKKGFVRDNDVFDEKEGKCIKTSECTKKECPIVDGVHFEESSNMWFSCDKNEDVPFYGIACNGGYSPIMNNETVLYHFLDIDHDDADEIKYVMRHTEAATCIQWRQLPLCCRPKVADNGKPFNNYVNISESRWCWFRAESGEEGCRDIFESPREWTDEMIFYMLLLSLGLQDDSEREEPSSYITVNLKININGRNSLSAQEKLPYSNEYELHKNPPISVTIGEKTFLLQEKSGYEMKTAKFSLTNLQKINDLFHCPPKDSVW